MDKDARDAYSDHNWRLDFHDHERDLLHKNAAAKDVIKMLKVNSQRGMHLQNSLISP